MAEIIQFHSGEALVAEFVAHGHNPERSGEHHGWVFDMMDAVRTEGTLAELRHTLSSTVDLRVVVIAYAQTIVEKNPGVPDVWGIASALWSKLDVHLVENGALQPGLLWRCFHDTTFMIGHATLAEIEARVRVRGLEVAIPPGFWMCSVEVATARSAHGVPLRKMVIDVRHL
eukprot:m51a1_g14797 hypothetical protein (172) ;mRNA; r:526450-527092